MKTNYFQKSPLFTFEGAKSSPIPPIQQLRRISLACMLWEDTFYVDGKKSVEILDEVCSQLDQLQILNVALEANCKGLLRHLPLKLIVNSFKSKKRMNQPFIHGQKMMMPSDYIFEICNRPDQMTELLSLYWKDGKKPIPAQLKKGLAKAFTRFDEYQLAKYNRDNPIKLRDILFLCHAKPKDKEQEFLWKKLISSNLSIPETWETKLSSGMDKKESFQELLEKGKMGKLAIVRNLRNMFESGISKEIVEKELMRKSRPILPFQFLAAAKECPQWEDIIDKAMIQACEGKDKLDGTTVLLVDVSGSMNDPLSAKSTMKRMDAACGIAILLREICEQVAIYSFSNRIAVIPPRQGMALRDAIIKSQEHSGTNLRDALINIQSLPVKRVIVITDEQSQNDPVKMNQEKKYIINVGSYQNGILNNSNWLTITGFSEAVIDYIIEVEKSDESGCK